MAYDEFADCYIKGDPESCEHVDNIFTNGTDYQAYRKELLATKHHSSFKTFVSSIASPPLIPFCTFRGVKLGNHSSKYGIPIDNVLCDIAEQTEVENGCFIVRTSTLQNATDIGAMNINSGLQLGI